MPGAAIGALLGFVLSGTGLGIGIAGFLGISAGTLWMVGASLGSLFDGPDIDLGGSTPNYTFGQLSNTKSQMLPIPIVYGRCRIGGNIFMQTFYDDTLQKMDMLVGVSEGPIQSIKSIYASDTELTDVNGDITHELEEVTLNVHLGEPDQVADSRDPSGSTYAHVAYVGLTLKAQDGLSGNPTISSIVEGRKIWTPVGTVFSRNPAWIVYDFLTNTRYGVGVPQDLIDLDSFMASADYCDALVEGEPRFTLDYIIDIQRPAVDHLQSMLACFRGYFLARDKIELHVEQAGSIYKALGPDNFVKDSFTWWQKSGDDSPNRLTLEWIDPDNHYEQSSAVFEAVEDIAARGVFEKSFSVLGITRSSQVGRLGNYLMETAKRVQNFCSFQVGLQDADIEAGEIISLTYPDFTGWDSKPFRVVAVQDHGDSGVVIITCAEYDAAVYGDDALPVQTPIVDPTPVTYDDVYALVLNDIGYIADDGTWFPVIRATWQNPSDYTPAALNIRWRYSGDTVWNLHLNTSRLTTQTNITGLTTGEDLEVWVNCVKPNNGGETTGVTATLSVGRDVTPPAAPASLTATGWFGSINLEWLNPADRDLSHIEVWENAIDNRATAVKIAETKGNAYQRYVGSFITRYYWVRAVDLSGNIGAWNATAGTAGNSDQENHQDFVDLLLEENPYLNEAIGDLNTGIGVVENRIDEVMDIDLPGAVQRLAERISAIDERAMDQLKSVSDAAVDALLNIKEIGGTITDAGIVTDPDTGEVRIWAIDQLRTEYGVRLSNAEILVSALESQISLKASLADIDERIAQAVFGDAGELLISGLEAQISEVVIELDAVKSQITLMADETVTDSIGGRIHQAEIDLSGAKADILLKADAITVSELDTRVHSAELDIDALNGMIAADITEIGYEGRDLSTLTGEGLVEAILNDADNRERDKISLAHARNELYARLDEGLNAEAGQRTTLAAVVAGNTSKILSESYVRSTADSAMTSQINALQSTVGQNTADIVEERNTRADGDESLASTISTVSATANAKNKTYRQASAPTTGMTAGDLWFDSDANNKAYRYSGSSWVATDDTRIAQNTADIQTEQTARADGDSAVASQVTTLQTTTVGGTVTESASAPSSPTAGQVYYNTTSKKYFRWSGTAWVEVKGVEGHSRSAIQIINESVDGIKGKHAVKIDTNGYVTGYELIGTGTTSSMVFHVENFLVGKPGTTNKYPFVIGTVDGVSRVSMDSAFIQDAAISSAKIKDAAIESAKIKNAAVETLKIAGNAVSVMSAATGSTPIVLSGTYTTFLSVTINTLAGYPVLITCFANTSLTYGTCYLRILRGGSTLITDVLLTADTSLDAAGFYVSVYRSGSYQFIDPNPPSGNTVYSVQLRFAGARAGSVYARSMTATHVKR